MSIESNPSIPTENPSLFVITGGPGAGKTILLRELQRRGYACAPEVAREIIQEQVRSKGDALPWGNTTRYAELMLERSIASFVDLQSTRRITFVDRGIPDVLAYARIIGLAEVDAIVAAARCYRYYPSVFVAPPWKEIYETDAERKPTWAEAVEVHRQIVRVYGELGYELVELPRTSVMGRAEFMLRVVEEVVVR